MSASKRRFVALDRDGTIIVERNYLSDPAAVELLPGAAAGLRRMAEMGLGLIVVTNQSGIGRGMFDEKRLGEIHARMNELLAAERVRLDGIYYCPHRPEDGCQCRKPRPGLIERAARELGFDAKELFVIGDKECDIELGQRAGAKTILVMTGYGAEHPSDALRPDWRVDSLAQAAEVIEAALVGKK